MSKKYIKMILFFFLAYLFFGLQQLSYAADIMGSSEGETSTSEEFINVALNKTATAQSWQEYFSPSLAVDQIGDNNSYWSADPYSQWWKVDLGENYDLSYIVIRNYSDGTRYYYYNIQASTDDVEYTTIATKESNFMATDAGDAYVVDVNARYLKVNMIYNSANTGVHISDFRAYTGTPPETTPTPAPMPAGGTFLPDWSGVSTKPFPVSPAQGVTNPIMTADMVTDCPNARYVADPFLFYENGTYYLFFEIFREAPLQGVIGLATSTNGLNWTYDRVVLNDKDYHMSYPYIFKYNDCYYMIPEIDASGTGVSLYKSYNFPYDWRFERSLISGINYADPQIIQYNNKFWLFIGSPNSTTCRLFYSDDLYTGWTEHPQSPLIQNPGKARGGGRVFIYDGDKIIRTAMKNDLLYGEKVRAFQVDTLTTTSYSEHEIQESPLLSPTGSAWNGGGMHQFDPVWTGSKWLVAVDGYTAGSNGAYGYSIGIYDNSEPISPPTPEVRDDIIGNNSNGTVKDSIMSDLTLSRFQAPQTINANMMRVNIASSPANTRWKCAVYSDSDGMPGDFLIGSEEKELSSIGWQNFNLTGTQTFTGGTAYWLAVWSDGRGEINADTGGSGRYIDLSYSDWPANLSGTSSNGYKHCIYAEYSSLWTPPITPTPEPTPEEGVNVALGKTATAQSWQDYLTPSLAVDSDSGNSSYWSADPYTQWWKVDLGENFDLSRIVIRNYVDGTRYYHYNIQASTDDVNYTTIATKESDDIATDAGDAYIVDVAARYLKVNMLYNSENPGVHISDFRAYTGTP